MGVRTLLELAGKIRFTGKRKSPETIAVSGLLLVEISGIEPLTS